MMIMTKATSLVLEKQIPNVLMLLLKDKMTSYYILKQPQKLKAKMHCILILLHGNTEDK